MAKKPKERHTQKPPAASIPSAGVEPGEKPESRPRRRGPRGDFIDFSDRGPVLRYRAAYYFLRSVGQADDLTESLRWTGGIPRWVGVKPSVIGRCNQFMSAAQRKCASLLDRAMARDVATFQTVLPEAVVSTVQELARGAIAAWRTERALRRLRPAMARAVKHLGRLWRDTRRLCPCGGTPPVVGSADRLPTLDELTVDRGCGCGRVFREAACRAFERLGAIALAEVFRLPSDVRGLRAVLRWYLHITDLRAAYCHTASAGFLERSEQLRIRHETVLDRLVRTAQQARDSVAERLCMATEPGVGSAARGVNDVGDVNNSGAGLPAAVSDATSRRVRASDLIPARRRLQRRRLCRPGVKRAVSRSAAVGPIGLRMPQDGILRGHRSNSKIEHAVESLVRAPTTTARALQNATREQL